jgi:hypothetical protein
MTGAAISRGIRLVDGVDDVDGRVVVGALVDGAGAEGARVVGGVGSGSFTAHEAMMSSPFLLT